MTAEGVFVQDIDKGVEEGLVKFSVNGNHYELTIKTYWTLAYVLREKLNYTGTKIACDNGACGSCTVLVDDEPTLSCLTLAIECEDKKIMTIEGLSDGITLHPIQEAWLEEHGTQCGFCAPGIIMNAKAFLEKNPEPTREDVRQALAGNICRCGNYEHIVQSVLSAAKKMEQE